MFSFDVFLAYTVACVVLVLAPGPDNLLAIGRGLSQGKYAAWVSGLSSGLGIVFHTLAATLGLTLLIQTSDIAFWLVKLMGAGYLLFLGIKVLRSRNLVSFKAEQKEPLRKIFLTGFLSAALNPKPGLFVLAFIPQFVHPDRGDITTQMVVYGFWFALLTGLGFALMGTFAAGLSQWLRQRPRTVVGLNIGAGITFVAAGLSVVALKQK